MITLRQNCIKCDTAIEYQTVNMETGIYACSHCNTVSSIYEERRFKNVTTLQKPIDVEVHITGNSLCIDFKQKGVIHVGKSTGYLLLGLFLLSFFFLLVNTSLGAPILGIFIATIVVVSFVNKGQKTRIQITPYTLEVFGLKQEKRNDVTLVNIPTFMIDQLYVHKYEKVDRDSDTGRVRRRYFVYELVAWMKDMCEERILLPIEEKDKYLYIEKVIESHLGIADREMSRGE